MYSYSKWVEFAINNKEVKPLHWALYFYFQGIAVDGMFELNAAAAANDLNITMPTLRNGLIDMVRLKVFKRLKKGRQSDVSIYEISKNLVSVKPLIELPKEQLRPKEPEKPKREYVKSLSVQEIQDLVCGEINQDVLKELKEFLVEKKDFDKKTRLTEKIAKTYLEFLKKNKDIPVEIQVNAILKAKSQKHLYPFHDLDNYIKHSNNKSNRTNESSKQDEQHAKYYESNGFGW